MDGGRLRLACFLALLGAGCAEAPAPGEVSASDGLAAVDATRFLDLTTIGYQGWFAAAGDDSPLGGWSHWAPGTAPRAGGRISFELYPDTREYAEADLHPTGLGDLGDGRGARLF